MEGRIRWAGAERLHQDFLALDLPPVRFDGIFANASLFHVPSSQLARVLGDFAATLRPGGVLFCSNPRGRNEEGWAGGRYGYFHDLETWRTYVTAVGFREWRHYYRPPGLSQAQQPWLATVWRKGTGAGGESGPGAWTGAGPVRRRHGAARRMRTISPCSERS